MDSRLTPASRKPRNRAASTDVGLASSVISAPSASVQPPAMAPITAATVSGAIRLGVPPPKNTVSTTRPGTSAAVARISATSARRQRSWSTPPRTWLLKSQYGHLAAQNGQWT